MSNHTCCFWLSLGGCDDPERRWLSVRIDLLFVLTDPTELLCLVALLWQSTLISRNPSF